MEFPKPAWRKYLGAILGGAILVIAAPLLMVVYVWLKVYGLVLFILWNFKHGRYGRRFLVVFSSSPKWGKLFEEELVPFVSERGVVVNTTIDNQWSRSRSIGRRAHKYWGGTEEHTPIVMFFPRFGRVRVFRFYKAFVRKKENGVINENLRQIKALAGNG